MVIKTPLNRCMVLLGFLTLNYCCPWFCFAQSWNADRFADKLIIRSYPVGLKCYLLPKSEAQHGFGNIQNEIVNIHLEKDYIGNTPLEISIPPGDYYITIVSDESKVTFLADGEIQINSFFSFTPDGKIPDNRPYGKTYFISKTQGHSPVVNAVFWPSNISLHEFVGTISVSDGTFPTMDINSLKDTFLEYGIPSDQWSDLSLEMQKIGKLVWHGGQTNEYLYVSFPELFPNPLLGVEHPVKGSTTTGQSTAGSTLRPTTSVMTIPRGMASAPLKVHAPAGPYDYFIKLDSIESGETALKGYIRAGETLDTTMPLGDYKLKYAIGSTWLGDRDLFGNATQYYSTRSTLSFRISSRGYEGQEVTLVLQAGGNLQVDPVSANSF